MQGINSPKALESYSQEELLNFAYDYKEKYIAAEHRASLLQGELSAKDFRVNELERKLAEANAKLRESDNAQINFMSAGDKLAAEKKLLIQGISHDIAEELKPFIKKQIESSNSITESKKKMEKQLGEIHQNTVRMGQNIVRSQADIETTSNLLDNVISVLSKAGINESCNVDISSSVGVIMEQLGVGNDEMSSNEGTPVTPSGPYNPQQSHSMDQPPDASCLPKMNVNTNQSMTHVPSIQPQFNHTLQGSTPGQYPPHQGQSNFSTNNTPPFNRKKFNRFKAARRIVNNWNKQFGQGDQYHPNSGYNLPPTQSQNMPQASLNMYHPSKNYPYHPYANNSNALAPQVQAPGSDFTGHDYSGHSGYPRK